MKKIMQLFCVLLLPAMIQAQTNYDVAAENSAQHSTVQRNTISEYSSKMLQAKKELSNKVEQDSVRNENAILKIYPNPATDRVVSMDFKIKEEAFIRVDVYDANGNHSLNVINNVKYNPGDSYTIQFSIESLPIGKYEIRLLVGDDYKTKPLMVVR